MQPLQPFVVFVDVFTVHTLVGLFTLRLLIADTMDYFTNWMWCAFIAFFVLAVSGSATIKSQLWRWSMIYVFPVAHALAWVVFVLFCIVSSINADTILQFVTPRYHLGLVLLGDRIAHQLPPFALLVYCMIHRSCISSVFKAHLKGLRTKGVSSSMLYFVGICWTLPIAVVLIYMLTHDVRAIYRITSDIAWILCIVFAILTPAIVNYSFLTIQTLLEHGGNSSEYRTDSHQ